MEELTYGKIGRDDVHVSILSNSIIKEGES